MWFFFFFFFFLSDFYLFQKQCLAPGTKVSCMVASQNQQYVFCSGTNGKIAVCHAKNRKVVQVIATDHTNYIRFFHFFFFFHFFLIA